MMNKLHMYNTKIDACAFKDLNFSFFPLGSIHIKKCLFWGAQMCCKPQAYCCYPGATGTSKCKGGDNEQCSLSAEGADNTQNSSLCFKQSLWEDKNMETS